MFVSLHTNLPVLFVVIEAIQEIVLSPGCENLEQFPLISGSGNPDDDGLCDLIRKPKLLELSSKNNPQKNNILRATDLTLHFLP